ncbi:putative ubiquitin-like-specific protease 1B, partial [Bienertia sinuspersici]
CPRQQNGNDCGYFVMRYMKEIIEHKQTQLQVDYYFDCNVPSYEQGQIDEVGIELARQIFLLI